MKPAFQRLHIPAMAGRAASCGLVLALLLLGGCGRESAEQRLRAQVAQMQEALAERRPGDFMEAVAEDFTGTQGMDRAALHNLLRAQLLANARMGATLGPLDVQLREDTATVAFTVVLTGGNQRLLPERMQSYRVTSGWRDQGGQWRVYYAEWKPQ